VTTPAKPAKPTPDFPLFPHASGQWAKKIKGKLRYFGPWSDPDAALQRFQGATTPVKIASSGRPPKPHKDFPLFPHASGQWAKKVRGKLYYFGPWADHAAALKRWTDEKDDLLAGRVPSRGDGLTVRDLVNRFLTSKRRRFESGELDERTWQDYDAICKRVLDSFGKGTHVESLRPADFARLRAEYAKTHGPVSLGNDINRTRVIFNFAWKNHLVDRPVRFGDEFSRPSRTVLRKARKTKGPRLFTAAEINKLLKAAPPQMKAMILLGINCGLGNMDCARLTREQIDGNWLDYPRPKTGIDRRCPLWKETVAAIKAVKRPNPKSEEHANRVFITRYGFTWEPKALTGDSPITKEIDKLLKSLGIKRPGLSFYALRHTFQTIGEQTMDKDAVRYIMGHVESANDMSAVYSEERPSDERLQAVAKHVRGWLFKKASRKKVA
jgi:integrase